GSAWKWNAPNPSSGASASTVLFRASPSTKTKWTLEVTGNDVPSGAITRPCTWSGPRYRGRTGLSSFAAGLASDAASIDASVRPQRGPAGASSSSSRPSSRPSTRRLQARRAAGGTQPRPTQPGQPRWGATCARGASSTQSLDAARRGLLAQAAVKEDEPRVVR